MANPSSATGQTELASRSENGLAGELFSFYVIPAKLPVHLLSTWRPFFGACLLRFASLLVIRADSEFTGLFSPV